MADGSRQEHKPAVAGEMDVEEIDLDGDGTVDAVIVTETDLVDVNGDGTVDALVVTKTTMIDADGDGTVDAILQDQVMGVDVDGDGTIDEVEVTEVAIGLDGSDEAPAD